MTQVSGVHWIHGEPRPHDAGSRRTVPGGSVRARRRDEAARPRPAAAAGHRRHPAADHGHHGGESGRGPGQVTSTGGGLGGDT